MTCPWNNDGKWIPDGTCPLLYHSLYPYFLGFVFGARYGLNDRGDCQVCCPAEKGVDVIAKVRPCDYRMPKWVPGDWRDVIHAEVVRVNGNCPFRYQPGDLIIFPTCAKKDYVCPALVNNFFPIIRYAWENLSCMTNNRLRCPDWKEDVYFDTTRDLRIPWRAVDDRVDGTAGAENVADKKRG